MFGRRRGLRRGIGHALAADLADGQPWMYDWRLTRRVTTPVLGPELPGIHRTRAEIIEPAVRSALSRTGSGARALDLACNEGWFAHRLLEWGASEVVAVDVRAQNIHRAELIREHFGIPAHRLRLLHADVYDLDADALGRFDVVLCLGLIYHLENPIGALRIARSLTAGTCVVETQTTRQADPIVTTWGQTDQTMSLEASWAAYPEPAPEQRATTLASIGPVVSLVPNRAALVQAMTVVGFSDVQVLPADPDHNPQYVCGDRTVALGRA
jgi:tRNA (mo5U34)-methyltransferase